MTTVEAMNAPAASTRNRPDRHSRRSAARALLMGTSLLAIMSSVGPALAQSVSTSGSVTPGPSTSPTWTVPGTVTVGDGGMGSLSISGPGQVQAGNGVWVGRNAGGDGTVTIDGPSAGLTASAGGVSVGSIGAQGAVTVSTGAHLEVIGNLTITQNGGLTSYVYGDALRVGAGGTGSLEVTSGGTVGTDFLTIGSASGSDGSVVIDGSGSTVTVREFMELGGAEPASLTISNGGTLNTVAATQAPGDRFFNRDRIGSEGAQSTVLVTGVGSAWNAGGSVEIGNSAGEQALLRIEDDAAVTVQATLIIGRGLDLSDPSGLAELEVDNATLDVGQLQFADAGARVRAVIGNGAQVNSQYTFAGSGSTYDGTTSYYPDLEVLLTGAGTVWNNSSTDAAAFRWGGTGTSTLEVFDQARLAIAGGMQIGMSDSSNNASSAILSVDGGSAVDVEGGVSLGNDPDGSAMVTMSDANSTFDIGLDLIIGNTGSAEFNINGGTVTQGGNTPNGGSTSTIVANAAGSLGYLRLLGPDAVLDATALDIGRGGEGSMLVEFGGQAETQLTAVGRLATGNGFISVGGAGSHLDAGNLNVGIAGQGRMTVWNGGSLDSIVGTIGDLAGSEGSVSVNSSSSRWTNATLLTIGSRGEGSLSISGGATVETEDAIVGAYAGGSGRVTVRDAGSLFDTGLDLYVGDAGTGELIVRNGGEVRQGDDTPNLGSTYTYIGRQAGASGDLLVTGAGSEFDGMNTWVGDRGQGSFTVADGAYAQTYIRAGQQQGGVGMVRVTGAGSHLYASPIDIGYRGQGYLEILDGGYVDTGSLAFIGSLATGEGHALVSGGGSHWRTGFLSVGSLGSGTLTVADGGYVETGIASYIGEGVGSSGAATVTGAGSHWETGGELAVGWFGDASLTIADQGLVEAASVTIADQSGATGALVVGTTQGSGRLEAATVSIGDGVGAIAGLGTIVGDVTVNSGILSPGAGTTLGTLTVDGDVAFGPGSTFAVRIAGDGANDALAATTASLGGEVVVSTVSSSSSFVDGQTYTILTSSDPLGVTGMFAGARMLNSAFLSPTLTHNADNVELTIALTSDFTSVAQTYNQRQVSGALNDLEQTGDALAVFNAIAGMSADEARRAFDLTSGEVHAAGQHVIDQTFGQFSHALLRQGGSGAPDAPAFAAPLGYGPAVSVDGGVLAIDEATAPMEAGAHGAWVAPLGGLGRVDGDGNAGAIEWSSAGLAGGYQGPIDFGPGHATGGVGFGYIGSHGAIDSRLSSYDGDGFYLGAHGAWTDGPWSLAGSLAYGATHISTQRDLAFVGRSAEADYWTHAVGFAGEASYGFELTETTRIAPLFTLDAGWSGHGAFTETGAGALNLTAAAESWARLDAGIGIALTHTLRTENGDVTLEGRAVWEHAFADTVPSQTLSLGGSPTSFGVQGPSAAPDRLRLGTGFSWDIANGASLTGSYDGVFSSDEVSHSVALGLNVRF